jgi:hypothetical protein
LQCTFHRHHRSRFEFFGDNWCDLTFSVACVTWQAERSRRV